LNPNSAIGDRRFVTGGVNGGSVRARAFTVVTYFGQSFPFERDGDRFVNDDESTKTTHQETFDDSASDARSH
jgi:hypothetical protein